MDSAERFARICKALSAETRVRIVELLRDQCRCGCSLCGCLDVTQGAVSQHLRVLRDAGLVIAERRGCFVHYRLNHETFAEFQAACTGLTRVGPTGAGRCESTTHEEKDKSCAAKKKRKGAASPRT